MGNTFVLQTKRRGKRATFIKLRGGINYTELFYNGHRLDLIKSLERTKREAVGRDKLINKVIAFIQSIKMHDEDLIYSRKKIYSFNGPRQVYHMGHMSIMEMRKFVNDNNYTLAKGIDYAVTFTNLT